MKFFNYKYISLVYVAFTFALLINTSTAFGQNSTNGWSNVKFAIYFTHNDVENLLADSIQFQKTMEYFAPVKAYKVYLEGNSHGGEVNLSKFDNNLLSDFEAPLDRSSKLLFLALILKSSSS